jgi:hypothetical protein
MIDPNRQLLESAADLLRPLLDELVFVGGCATGLLITDPGSGGVRPTRDVDTITQISNYGEYATLSERLRSLGLTEDTDDGVICRWRHGELIIDVMPTDEKILGFSSRWYSLAIKAARDVDIKGARIRLITAPYFVATKLEAFHGRGRGLVPDTPPKLLSQNPVPTAGRHWMGRAGDGGTPARVTRTRARLW